MTSRSDNPYFRFTATAENDASVRATRDGSLALITPLTAKAEAWLRKHVDEEARWLNDQLVVEMHFFPVLADGLMAAGFTFERNALPN